MSSIAWFWTIEARRSSVRCSRTSCGVQTNSGQVASTVAFSGLPSWGVSTGAASGGRIPHGGGVGARVAVAPLPRGQRAQRLADRLHGRLLVDVADHRHLERVVL